MGARTNEQTYATLVITHRLHRGHHHPEVLGCAAGHHRRNGNALDSGDGEAEVRRGSGGIGSRSGGWSRWVPPWKLPWKRCGKWVPPRSNHLGGQRPSSWAGGKPRALIMAATLAGVGGTSGRPSDQPWEYIKSEGSTSAGMDTSRPLIIAAPRRAGGANFDAFRMVERADVDREIPRIFCESPTSGRHSGILVL